jgi:hypothetical protein
MSRICIFHDRQDFDQARLTADAVRALGHEPWLANSHSGGDWRRDVSEALRDPQCVAAVVVWSFAALSNTIVVEEAEEVLLIGRPMLGLVLGDLHLPIGLRNTPRLLLEEGASPEEVTHAIRDKPKFLTAPCRLA